MRGLNRLVEKVAGWLDWMPALLTRLVLGIVFALSGWGKLSNLPQVIEFFGGLGLPFPELQAPFVAIVELVCGVMLILGFVARLAAIPLIVIMVVALLTAKLAEMHGSGDLFSSAEFLYILLLVWIVVKGAGTISLDRFFPGGKG
jgi:putative oxidoreductase